MRTTMSWSLTELTVASSKDTRAELIMSAFYCTNFQFINLLLLLFYLRDEPRYLRTYYVGLLHRSNITPKTGTVATFVITDFQTVFICT
jgi:hypothetical protein